MASTAVPAVREAVLKTLEEAEELKGVLVTGDKEPERPTEYIWIYKAKANREFSLIGMQPAPLDEMVRVYLRVVAVKGSADSTPSEERALELAALAETALRENPTLNDCARFHHVEELEPQSLLFDQKRGCHVLMTIAAKARI